LPRFVRARILGALGKIAIGNGKTLIGGSALGLAVAVEFGSENPQGYESP
jgi:hypothetical protein